MTDIETKLNLDRRKLVALALLLGCDYHQAGVSGVGKEKAMELLRQLKETDILERFEMWRNGNVFASIDTSLLKKNLSHCEICRHPGTVNKHVKDGCEFCGSTQQCIKNDLDFHCGCSWHQTQNIKLEFSIREKALKDPLFPSKEVIKEFLEFKEPIDCKKVQWMRPSLTDFQEIITRTLCWTVQKISEKIFPLITHWQIMKIISQSESESQEISEDFIMEPCRIIKDCVRKFVKCFQVEWDCKGYSSIDSKIITIEVMNLFKQAYPRLTEAYYDEHQKPTDHSRKRKEKALSNTTHKKSSKQEKGKLASHNSKKVSKGNPEMVLSQTNDVDSVIVKDEYTQHTQEFSHPKETHFHSEEIFNIPLSERIITKMSQLSVSNDTVKSSNKSYNIPKDKLPQVSSYANSNLSSIYTNDNTNKSSSLPVNEKQYDIAGLAYHVQNCQLSDCTSSDDSMDEFLDRLIDKNKFEHSIICIDSDSDDDGDFSKGVKASENGTIHPSYKEKESESEIIAEIDLCEELSLNIGSPSEGDENCEFSPLPLRERLKNRFL